MLTFLITDNFLIFKLLYTALPCNTVIRVLKYIFILIMMPNADWVNQGF